MIHKHLFLNLRHGSLIYVTVLCFREASETCERRRSAGKFERFEKILKKKRYVQIDFFFRGSRRIVYFQWNLDAYKLRVLGFPYKEVQQASPKKSRSSKTTYIELTTRSMHKHKHLQTVFSRL